MEHSPDLISFRYLKGTVGTSGTSWWVRWRSPFFHVPSSARPPINKLPATVDDLIDELDRAVPEMVPSADATLIEIQRHAGKRELVLFLKRLRDRREAPPATITRKR